MTPPQIPPPPTVVPLPLGKGGSDEFETILVAEILQIKTKEK